MILMQEYSFNDFFEIPNLALIIQEYANSSSNPLVHDVGLDYINVVKESYFEILKKENVSFHALTDNGFCKGVLVLIQCSNGNSPDTVIDINAIYVTPEYRKLGYGKKMFEYIDKYALTHGASGVYFQVPFGSRLERVLDKTNYFSKTYSLYYRSLGNGQWQKR